MKKTFIWFDLGYTLLYLNREEPFLKTLREFDLDADPDELERIFHLTDKYFMREYPGLFGGDTRYYMPWYFGVIQYHLGLRIDLCRFFQRWQQRIGTQIDSWFPYPFAADSHQETNAGMLVQVGGAELIIQKDLSGEGLAEILMQYMDDKEALKKMGQQAQKVGRPNASKVIVDQLVEMMNQ